MTVEKAFRLFVPVYLFVKKGFLRFLLLGQARLGQDNFWVTICFVNASRISENGVKDLNVKEKVTWSG